MKKFTKSLLTLVLLVLAVGSVNAQDEVNIKDLQAANGTTEDWKNSVPDYNIKVEDSKTIFGSDASGQATNANVNKYDYIYFEVVNFSTARACRIFFWDTNTNSRKDWFIRPVEGKEEVDDWGAPANVTGNGTYCVKIPAGARLQGAKTPWVQTPEQGTLYEFSKVYVIEPADPLAGLKDLLQQAINNGEAQNEFAKTTASWNTLQNAIYDGKEELKNDEATEKSLTDATEAITLAIAGLKLQDGYTNLTQNMYYTWDSATSPSEGSYKGGCDYYINVSTGQPYGNGSVPLLSFADLSEFDEFDILATGGLPRILLNRDVNEGQWSETEAESHLIDNTKGNAESWHAKYFSTSGSNVTVDLKQLATDKGFAHLHTIKTVGGNVTVTDMLLYRTVTVGATGYATFGSLYKNAKVNGVKAYAAIYNKETGKVALTEVTNVPAGVGVVIEGEAGEYAPTFDVAPADIASDLKVSNGTVTGDGSTIYVLAKSDSGIGFYKLADGKKLEAGKAYLEIAGSSPARGFIGFEGATGINEVNVNKAAAKTGKIYNLNGQIVSKPSKGLFIVDGKVVSF